MKKKKRKKKRSNNKDFDDLWMKRQQEEIYGGWGFEFMSVTARVYLRERISVFLQVSMSIDSYQH